MLAELYNFWHLLHHSHMATISKSVNHVTYSHFGVIPFESDSLTFAMLKYLNTRLQNNFKLFIQ